MVKSSSKTNTTEILVAIGVVIFIFSLIGMISINPMSIGPTFVASWNSEEDSVTSVEPDTTVDASYSSLPTSDSTSVSTEPGYEEIVLASGTSLSPAISQFEVNV